MDRETAGSVLEVAKLLLSDEFGSIEGIIVPEDDGTKSVIFGFEREFMARDAQCLLTGISTKGMTLVRSRVYTPQEIWAVTLSSTKLGSDLVERIQRNWSKDSDDSMIDVHASAAATRSFGDGHSVWIAVSEQIGKQALITGITLEEEAAELEQEALRYYSTLRWSLRIGIPSSDEQSESSEPASWIVFCSERISDWV